MGVEPVPKHRAGLGIVRVGLTLQRPHPVRSPTRVEILLAIRTNGQLARGGGPLSPTLKSRPLVEIFLLHERYGISPVPAAPGEVLRKILHPGHRGTAVERVELRER